MLVQTASASLAAVQQLERFFTALTTFLRNSGPGRPVLLSKIASSGPVQAEWTVLQRSRAIAPTVKMKQVILQRPHAYRIVTDHRNQPHVVLAAPPPHPLPGTTSPSLLGSTEGGGFDAQPAKSSPGTNGGGPSTGVALDLERMTAIEAHLLRSRGGQDFMSSIVATFGVDAAQVAAHFAVLPLPYGVLSSKKTGSAQVTTSTDALVSANSSGTLGSLAASTSAGVKALDQLLPNLVTERRAVCGLMVFCLDHARDAAAISRRLVASLVELRLSAESVLARLYLISDILFNAATLRAGSSRYVASLQDLLPEAFEQLGRAFLPTLEEPERARVEEKVRSVLIAWKDLEPFPPLYPRGLEALFFAPVLPEVGSLEGLKASADAELRGRLARWLSGAEQVRLPKACRLRGLAGKVLPTSACRARLCHFEQYFHSRGIILPDVDADESFAVAAENAERQRKLRGEVVDEVEEELGSIDGDPLSSEELAAVQMEVEAAAAAAAAEAATAAAAAALRPRLGCAPVQSGNASELASFVSAKRPRFATAC